MKHLSHQNNFIYLCLALVGLLFSAALVQEFSHSWVNEIFSVIIILMLIVSIRSLKAELLWQKAVYILTALSLVLTVVTNLFELHFVYNFNLLVLLIFFIGSFFIAFKQIVFVGEVDRNKLIGSLSLYLLLGLIWTTIYLLLLTVDPNAFSGVTEASWQHNFSQIAYYSFVTLTTLGYGDILPTNRLAEFFVYMEAIVGVFYMAIVVSSLISLKLSPPTNRGE
ncbi:MAG: potassium channel family protein [Campylobacterota bacterium]|nr:potassium channel family protein [Campylobacterota bacterium]